MANDRRPAESASVSALPANRGEVVALEQCRNALLALGVGRHSPIAREAIDAANAALQSLPPAVAVPGEASEKEVDLNDYPNISRVAAELQARHQRTGLPPSALPAPAVEAVRQPAQDQMPLVLADYSQDQVDALDHGEIADRLRRYPHPLLKAAADSIDYLHAQEDLLEKAQQAAERARAELAETKRPLDEPMARLNQRVIDLTAELDALRLRLPEPASLDVSTRNEGGEGVVVRLTRGPSGEVLRGEAVEGGKHAA